LIKGQYARQIHLNHRHGMMNRKKERQDGHFVFSEKWPTSERDAYAGLMARRPNKTSRRVRTSPSLSWVVRSTLKSSRGMLNRLVV